MYEYEYGFTDNGAAIEVEVETKRFDFDTPDQDKTFKYIDLTGRKQEGGEINISVKVDQVEVST